MLSAKNIHKTFFPGSVNEKKALRGVDLTLEDGDFATVIGSNGAGKSTFLNAIAGVFPIDQGSIEIDGVDVTRMPEHERAKYIGRVFQDPMKGTAANMMIEENLAMASRRGRRQGLSWSSKPEMNVKFKALLAELDLGLEERMSAHVGLLSGGQRQAVTLLMELTTLMITHNMRDALRFGNRLIMMHAGRIVVDVKGEEKKNLTVPDLLAMFEKGAGMVSDAMMLS